LHTVSSVKSEAADRYRYVALPSPSANTPSNRCR
jgi:hypothetical protein